MAGVLNINQALTAQNQTLRPSWLVARQAKSLARLQQTAWPTRKTEAFKYTPLRALTDVEWQLAELSSAPGIQFDHWNEVSVPIRNGQIDVLPELPAGVRLVAISELPAAERETLLARLDAQDSGFIFDDLNQALVANPYYLSVADQVVVDQPIHLDYATSGDKQLVPSQVIIELGVNASATIAETFTAEHGAIFVNANSTLLLNDNAQLTHYHLLLEEGDVRHVGSVSAELQRCAKLRSFHMAAGGVLKRKDIRVAHKGEGAELSLNGVYLPTGKEVIDYHTSLEHEVAHCTSQEIFRGIIGDDARAVFNGRIHIHKDAQKSIAEMNNRNLLLSDRAEINTKPELEIYADDVRCAHGATIAQLDEQQLFYFQARGISREEAEVMLSFGFINELLDALPDEPVQLLIRPMLASLFASSQVAFTRQVI